MTDIITLSGIKGGTGKTTTAVHLAKYLSQNNKKVVVIDADEQCSSFNWCHFLDIPTVALDDPDELFDGLGQIDADCIIIDPPAGHREMTRVILSRADLAIVPCKASALDIHSLKQRTIRLIHQAQAIRSGKLQAFLFICQVKPQSLNLLNKARYILEGVDIPLADAVVYDRDAIANSIAEGTTVWDMPGPGAAKAREDYLELFKWVELKTN